MVKMEESGILDKKRWNGKTSFLRINDSYR
jgi:predicted transcriptional regulator